MSKFAGSLSIVLACSAALGCTDPAPADTGGAGGEGGGGGAGGSVATTGSTSDTGTTAGTTTTFEEPDLTTLKAQASLVTIASGEESVKCITVGLGNPDPIVVRKFRTSLNQGSHHMIVYKSDQPPSPDPFECSSFGVQGGSAIFIAQQASSELALPVDASGVPVGLELGAQQSLTLEIHYINATAAPIDVTGTVELDVLPATANVLKSGFAFQGAFSVPEIPAFGEADTGVLFQDGIPGTKVFALTTHQHHLGTRMRVWLSDSPFDLSKPIADSTSWSDPPLETYDPPLELPLSGNTGFSYQCEWKNTTPNPVYGGLGANDEMCFFWSYYYPTAF